MVSNDDRQEVLQRQVTVLREHFDAVQVVAVRSASDGTTTRFVHGDGCWYSRMGSVRSWMVREDEIERLAVHQEIEGDEDEGIGQ